MNRERPYLRWLSREEDGYVVLAHVATGDLATAALQNNLIDDLAVLKTSVEDDGRLKQYKIYPPTLADVVNTASETTALSFSVTGGDMKDGDIIEVWLSFKFKNTSVGGPTITAKWNWGASAQLTFVANTSTATNAAERLWTAKMYMQRVGADLWFYDTITGTNGGALPDAVLAVNSFDLSSNSNVGVIGAPTFSSTQTVQFKITLSAADLNFYIKPQAARIRLIGA